MAKRFTATEKWLDPWFCALSIADRLFWIYLLDNCDHAGIWQVNPLLVNTYFPGYELNPERFGGRVEVLGAEKWFIPKFVNFQYKHLSPKSRTHASVLERLKKEGVSKGYGKGIRRDKDKDTDTDKDKAKEEVREKVLGKGVTSAQLEVWFDKTWKFYPSQGRVKRKESFNRYQASVKSLRDARDCAEALEIYKQSERVKKGFIQNASTWFGDWQSWRKPDGDTRDECNAGFSGNGSGALPASGITRGGGFASAGSVLDRLGIIPKVQSAAEAVGRTESSPHVGTLSRMAEAELEENADRGEEP